MYKKQVIRYYQPISFRPISSEITIITYSTDRESKRFPSEFSINKNNKRNTIINIKIASLNTNKLILERTRELHNLEKSNTRYYYYKKTRLLCYQGPRNTTIRR
jgi:hypothetical protein